MASVRIVTKAEVEGFVKKNQDTANKDTPFPYTILDVREPAEVQATGLIPTAANVPLSHFNEFLENPDFKNRIPEMKEESFVVYCRSGARAQKAAEALTALGFTDVANYKGSAGEWFGL